ncbi:MAG: LPXTG cell wall anchor domain-containing protein [Alphaproteobacteria bacterium]|nr:LPXTG cell wall anchor domain-containing protein [Alphaproteobacteria bacterium]
MFEIAAKWTSGIAALCLLCCAAPLTLAFLGGGGVAASAILAGEPGLMAEVLVLAGLLVMAGAAWLIFRRRRLSGPACEVK